MLSFVLPQMQAGSIDPCKAFYRVDGQPDSRERTSRTLRRSADHQWSVLRLFLGEEQAK